MRLAIALLAALLVATAARAATVRYLKASVDSRGAVRLVRSDGRAITVAREKEQVGVDDIKVARSGRAVGWLALFPNCCTSYPIPLQLMVYANGRRRAFTGSGLPVFQWMFVGDGRRVAFEQETVHGGFGIHYELRDVASGRLIAQWDPEYGADNRVLAEQKPPAWVNDLNATAHIAPW